MRELWLLLKKMYEAGNHKDKYEAVSDMLRALTSMGVPREEAVEFIRVLVPLLYEHQCYRRLAADVEEVLEDGDISLLQTFFEEFQAEKQYFREVWGEVLGYFCTELELKPSETKKPKT